MLEGERYADTVPDNEALMYFEVHFCHRPQMMRHSGWEDMLTTKPYFAQGSHIDESGFPYLGAMWYRLEVDVP